MFNADLTLENFGSVPDVHEAAGGRARASREEERKAQDKHERELRLREKEKKRADALRLLEIWSEAENLLEKPSEFFCKIKFFNTLPDVPAEPKLMVIARPVESFGEFRPTSLQRDYRHDLIVGSDLSVPVDLCDPLAYQLPAVPPPLAPEDEALLTAEKETVAKLAATGKRRAPLQVPWLRKSEFITAVFDENLYNQSQAKGAVVVAGSREKELQELRRRHLAVVLESFEAARANVVPVHPRNRAMRVRSVQSILPSLAYGTRELTHVLVEDADGQSTGDGHDTVYFPLSWGRHEALVRVVRKRPRDGEPADEAGDGGVVHETTGIFAGRRVTGAGMDGKFVFFSQPGADLSYVPLEQRIELHDLFQDYRGPPPPKSKRYRIASRPENESDREAGWGRWLRRFGEDEDEDEEAEGGGDAATAAAAPELDLNRELGGDGDPVEGDVAVEGGTPATAAVAE